MINHQIIPQPDGTKLHIRSWKLIDACGNESAEVTQTIVESRCEFGTKTQGYNGNAGGTECSTGFRTPILLNNVLLTSPLTVGEAGRSFTKILLGQTITFALNLRLDPNLVTDLKLPSPTETYLWTIAADYVNGVCLDGNDIETGLPQYFHIPPSVLTAMGSNGNNLGLADLLAFANRALAGLSIAPATLSDVTAALGAYNRGFDNARFFAGYHMASPPKSVVRENVPTEFSLAQNHPNPFNPSTTISYTIPLECNVRLAIYNSLGNEVAILVDHMVPAGTHSVVWNSQESNVDLPSGVYTYRILATGSDGQEFHDVRKMMLVK
ncbi:MAG: hypothetical protein IH600_09080 [Bacteroidetes bacterium]|nr:hypothetical protein [Bacteroidota bacterium]